jgi:hypothetical protein
VGALSGADKNAAFEGTISATLTRAGTEATHFVFTRKGNLLRIENTTNKLEPINIVDLAANKLIIVYPHNTSFVHVDLAKKQSPPGAPPMPQMQMPNNPAGAPAMGMPPMPGMFGAAELKKTDKTKKIQGVDCTLYTITSRGEMFEIWATNDSALFPFRLIERDYLGHRFGPPMIEETWPELLRNKSLFPIEATLKMEPNGQEWLSFKIDKIDKGKIDNDKLFEAPEGYQEIQAPQF